MHNLIPKLRKTSIISKKADFLPEKQNFDELQLRRV